MASFIANFALPGFTGKTNLNSMLITTLSANLNSFDKPTDHVPQSMYSDQFVFTDENFPPRERAMTPRLQAKIPKFFGWQLRPGYDYYLWLDSNISLAHEDALQYFYDNCQGYDIVVLRHPRRPNIRQEVRYTRKGINQQSLYVLGRYEGEWHKEQYAAIQSDRDFKDDLLVNGGVFMYHNTPAVHAMFKEWWYHVTRYIIQDQISFPYVLKKSGLKINILPIDIYNCQYLKFTGHKYHAK